MSGNGYANSSGRTLGCGRGRELEKTSCGLVGEGVERVMLYRFVDAQKAEGFPVRMVCSVVGVSPSAYYAYRHRPRSGPAQLAEAALVDEIRAIWTESGGTYGSPRVCAELRRRGRVVNHKRVERLMKGHRMAGFVPRKRRVTTTADTAHRIPDLLRGDFTTAAPDEAWVGDIERHEAFSNRAVVGGHRCVLVAACT